MVRVIIFLLLMISVAHSQESTTIERGTSVAPIQVQQGSRPVPDPTALTAEAIDKLRTELTRWIELQFDNLQKQVDRNQLRLDGVSQELKDALNDSEKLINEKFKGVGDQFIARDNNLGTALSAQKDDAAKTERNFSAQITNTQKDIDDLKDRITRIESASSGAGGAVNWVIAGIGVFSVILGIGISLFALMKTPAPLPVVNFAPEPLAPQRRRT